MRKLYHRFKLILTVTGEPRVIAWWGVVFILAACVTIWADFVPEILAIFVAAFQAGFGMFLLMQAGDLKRRRNGR
jgi:hypothetical protein